MKFASLDTVLRRLLSMVKTQIRKRPCSLFGLVSAWMFLSMNIYALAIIAYFLYGAAP